MTPAEQGQGYGYLSDPSNNPSPPERPDPRDEWPPRSDEEAERMIAAAKGDPAEQGQRWTIKADGPDGRVDHFYADTDLMELEVVPATELEMCQRYFPFMRRSRDEAVRKLSACQEELARVRRAGIAAGRGHLAAATARDEAVKREKALVEAMGRIREALDGDLMHDDPIGEADDIARSALESRSEAMGPNDGVNPGCEECGGTGFIKVPDVDDLTDDDNCPCWMGRCNCASCQARAALDQSGKP